jgi:hypothetical protein
LESEAGSGDTATESHVVPNDEDNIWEARNTTSDHLMHPQLGNLAVTAGHQDDLQMTRGYPQETHSTAVTEWFIQRLLLNEDSIPTADTAFTPARALHDSGETDEEIDQHKDACLNYIDAISATEKQEEAEKTAGAPEATGVFPRS